ncbi:MULTISPECIES: hypothetical protein [unclassified Clostridium]|uniref:hypothetical protein n=1 Tax=unclassified Clostridium TaxID=2614128 RepID=UPI000297D519|nr:MULTISPECIES: hypothetical protein [unclassified Clostridium]EKQ50283.1 MAG: hypothetical protein A370_05729 [Clostridium sp. Maddingley MBC34-26]
MNEYDDINDYIEDCTRFRINPTKEQLINWCNELGMKIKSKDTKDIVIDKLLENGITWMDLYNKYKHAAYGIHPSIFNNKFNVTKYQREKMVKTGFLEIMYYQYDKIMPGIHSNVPYYSAEQYFSLTIEDIEIWKQKNIRGYKKDHDK